MNIPNATRFLRFIRIKSKVVDVGFLTSSALALLLQVYGVFVFPVWGIKSNK